MKEKSNHRFLKSVLNYISIGRNIPSDFGQEDVPKFFYTQIVKVQLFFLGVVGALISSIFFLVGLYTGHAEEFYNFIVKTFAFIMLSTFMCHLSHKRMKRLVSTEEFDWMNLVYVQLGLEKPNRNMTGYDLKHYVELAYKAESEKPRLI